MAGRKGYEHELKHGVILKMCEQTLLRALKDHRCPAEEKRKIALVLYAKSIPQSSKQDVNLSGGLSIVINPPAIKQGNPETNNT